MSPSQGSTIDSQFGTPWTVEYRGQFNYLDGLVAPFAILSESGEVIGFFFKAKEAAGVRDCVNACEGVDERTHREYGLLLEVAKSRIDAARASTPRPIGDQP